MNTNKLRFLRQFITVFLVLVLGALCQTSAGGAQRTARVGSPTGSSSPSAKPEKGAITSARVDEDFSKYDAITMELAPSTNQPLRAEYEEARKANPKLFPGQFLAAKMIAKIVSEKYPGVKVSDKDLLKGLAVIPTISFKQTLQLKGLSPEQAASIQKETAKRINSMKH